MSAITTGTGRVSGFTTNASLRPGHRVIVPCGQPSHPVPPHPATAQERTS